MRHERARGRWIGVPLIAVAAGLIAAVPASAATTLTTGTLTDQAGNPTAGTVRVYAWPHSDQGMSLPLLGTAQAAPDGTFAVMASDEAKLAELARQRDGWLDFTAVADTPGHQGEWTFTGFVDAQAGQVRVATPSAVHDGARISSVAAPVIRIRAKRQPRMMAAAAQRGRCQDKREVSKPTTERDLALVGELNNAYNDGTWAQFTYARQGSAETHFGVAKIDALGGIEIGGQNAISDTGKVSFPAVRRRYARKQRSGFEFRHQKARNNTCAVWEQVIRTTSWLGGDDDRQRQKGALDRCDPSAFPAGFRSGGTFYRDRNAAVRWTRAVAAFGVNLTAQSGFSKNVTLEYRWGGPPGKQHYLCGPDGRQSPMDAGRVFSGALRR